MPEPFDPRRALELAAELAADAASGRELSDVLERIAAVRAVAGGEEAAAFAALLESLGQLGEQAALSASLDNLTGLLNRRGFEAAMRREIERAYRAGQPISALVLRIDHFERVAEAGGVEASDRALRYVADLLRGCLRHLDVAARIGATTFRVLLPGAALDGAREVAERCRCAIAAAYLPETGALTATFGVATLPDHAANGAALVQATDAAFNTGVRRGRNCVATALPLRGQ